MRFAMAEDLATKKPGCLKLGKHLIPNWHFYRFKTRGSTRWKP